MAQSDSNHDVCGQSNHDWSDRAPGVAAPGLSCLRTLGNALGAALVTLQFV